jgi:diguanylate cyclase (GGDEF)-like protein
VYRFRWAVLSLLAGAGFVALLWWLRNFPYHQDPLLYSYLELVGSLVAFTYAANALVRFKGTHDRVSLLLAFGFVLAGLIEGFSSLHFRSVVEAGSLQAIPLAWMVSRTLLGVLLVAAVLAERRLPTHREPGREIAAAFLIVAAVTYLTSAAYIGAPAVPATRPDAVLPRPWDLLPAAIFLAAAVGYWRRLAVADSAFDRTIFVAAAMNLVCHLVATQSEQLLDAPFAAAQALKLSSYAVVLGGALLDNARLFDQVRHLAASDPLTGLANYRRFLDVLESELQRSRRTKRPFAVVLLDLDGLKKINDQHGHLVGSRAILRLSEILRSQCRSTDTAARYGGDEFALVLPETGHDAARRAALRVVQRVAREKGQPPLSVSVGVAVHPQNGETMEALLAAADRQLYAMKARGGGRGKISQIAACL